MSYSKAESNGKKACDYWNPRFSKYTKELEEYKISEKNGSKNLKKPEPPSVVFLMFKLGGFMLLSTQSFTLFIIYFDVYYG
jgi:hypothetical protein